MYVVLLHDSLFLKLLQTFQLRAHIYQARSLIGSDASGLSDPFARVIAGEFCKATQVIDETLSPTWDELLVFEEILVFGKKMIDLHIVRRIAPKKNLST